MGAQWTDVGTESLEHDLTHHMHETRERFSNIIYKTGVHIKYEISLRLLIHNSEPETGLQSSSHWSMTQRFFCSELFWLNFPVERDCEDSPLVSRCLLSSWPAEKQTPAAGWMFNCICQQLRPRNKWWSLHRAFTGQRPYISQEGGKNTSVVTRARAWKTRHVLWECSAAQIVYSNMESVQKSSWHRAQAGLCTVPWYPPPLHMAFTWSWRLYCRWRSGTNMSQQSDKHYSTTFLLPFLGSASLRCFSPSGCQQLVENVCVGGGRSVLQPSMAQLVLLSTDAAPFKDLIPIGATLTIKGSRQMD